LLVPVLVGAVIGYITNYLAIRMLFRPLETKYLFGKPLPFTPGLIPKERDRLAARTGQAVKAYLLTEEAVLTHLESSNVPGRMETAIRNFLTREADKDTAIGEVLAQRLVITPASVAPLLGRFLVKNRWFGWADAQTAKSRVETYLAGKMHNERWAEPVIDRLKALFTRTVAEGTLDTTAADALLALFASGEQDVVISTCCHSANLLVQKYFPHLLKYMAKRLSPMQTHAKMMKEKDPDAKVVFIGPCIAKKEEAEQYPDIVDAVLTFEELEEWMEEEDVSPVILPDERLKGRARLFPIPGGIIRSMKADRPGVSYMAIDGAEQCIKALRDLENGALKNCFIEMSICEGSCAGGPVMGEQRYSQVRNRVQVESFSGPEHWKIDSPVSNALYKTMNWIKVDQQTPDEEEIKRILAHIGKTKPEDELNCGSCGYNTCRSKALAVYRGKADLSMCMPFLKEKAESFSNLVTKNTPNGIIVADEQLNIQMMNPTARHWFSVAKEEDIRTMRLNQLTEVDEYIEAMLTGRVISGRKSFDSYGITAEQNVVYDENFRAVIIILRDITGAESERSAREQLTQQTLEITDQVINKQMRIVQEIASLLGETTAETKIALSQLQERLRDE
jgi:uncharacterized Fe-S cluster-containing protein